jgi:hypothetical protein
VHAQAARGQPGQREPARLHARIAAARKKAAVPEHTLKCSMGVKI